MNAILAQSLIILAQTDISTQITSFKAFLAKILLLIGVAVVAYGGYLISRQGQTLEGIICMIGGFIIAMAVPILTWMAALGGITF